RAYQRASKIVAISRRTANDLAHLHPEVASKVAVIYLGADHMRANERASPSERPVAMAFAQHVNKQPELVIKAWALLKGGSPTLPMLTVVGANAQRARELRRLADSLNLSPNLVSISGVIDHSAYAKIVSATRLLVFPS